MEKPALKEYPQAMADWFLEKCSAHREHIKAAHAKYVEEAMKVGEDKPEASVVTEVTNSLDSALQALEVGHKTSKETVASDLKRMVG